MILSNCSSGQRHLIFSHRRIEGAGSGTTESGYTLHGLTYQIEPSSSLSKGSWNTGTNYLQEISVVSFGDGTEIVTVRLKAPISDPHFVRLVVTKL